MHPTWVGTFVLAALVFLFPDKGWVFPYEGTLEDAQAKWPAGVSLGKLGIAYSDGQLDLFWMMQSVT